MDINFGLKARQLANLNKWSALKTFCLEKLEKNPDEHFALYYLALSYQAQGNIDKAIEIIEPIYSNSKDFKSLFADLCLQKKSFKKSEAIYEDLLTNNPIDEFNIAKLSKSKLGLLKYKEAQDLAKNCLAINPNNNEAIQVYFLASDFLNQDGIIDAKSLLESNPNNVTLLVKYVSHLINKSKPEKAYEIALSGLQNNPNDEQIKDTMRDAILANHSLFKLINSTLRLKYILVALIVALIILKFSNLSFSGYHGLVLLYSFTTLILFSLIKNAIGSLFVFFDDLGRNVQPDLERKCIPIIGLLIITSIGMLAYSLSTSSTPFLKYGFLLLFTTVPIQAISNLNGSLLKRSVFAMSLFLVLAIYSIMNNHPILTFINFILLISFSATIGVIFYLEINFDKAKAKTEIQKT